MQEYVLVYAEPTEGNDILLIRKEKPDWQKGKLNLVGGKVEDDELAGIAAIREFKEETGYGIGDDEIDYAGQMCGMFNSYPWNIWVWRAKVNRHFHIEEEREKVSWFSPEILWNCDLIPNLRVIIPLCQSKIDGWVIDYGYHRTHGDDLSFKVHLSR